MRPPLTCALTYAATLWPMFPTTCGVWVCRLLVFLFFFLLLHVLSPALSQHANVPASSSLRENWLHVISARQLFIMRPWATLALLWALPVLSSPGDNLDEFEDCCYQCEQISCYNNPYHVIQEEYRDIWQAKDLEFHRYEPSWHFDGGLPWYLKLLQWDCRSNCDYQCQRIITEERIANDEEVYQFHGKWPFLRVAGIQEMASVVFSIGNFLPHYYGFWKVREVMAVNPPARHIVNGSLYNLMMISVVTMFAWTFSTIFHIRDFVQTEKLDYYFAGLTVLTGFYCIGYRYFRLYLPRRRIASWVFGASCIAAYSAHIYRLETDWLYTYNMQANIMVGILQNVLWCLTCFALYTRYYNKESGDDNVVKLDHLNYIVPGRIIMGSFYSKSAKLYSLYPLMLCFIVVAGMSLEIFDFPPVFYDLVDAHSLWHLVTIFPAFLGWYDWMIWDVNENVYEDLALALEKKEQ